MLDDRRDSFEIAVCRLGPAKDLTKALPSLRVPARRLHFMPGVKLGLHANVQSSKYGEPFISQDQEPGMASGVCRGMADLPRNTVLGTQEDSAIGKPIDTAESEDFMTCPGCGGVIDLLDLAVVLAHLAPLPHPAQDKSN
jgi:hypothetical protein